MYARALRPLAATLVLCLSGAAAAQSGERYRWSHDGNDGQIELYTSPVPEHGYDAVKGVATLTGAADTLIMLLHDFPRYPRWIYHCAAVQVLHQPSETPAPKRFADGGQRAIPAPGLWLLFFLLKTPPLDDRWAVLEAKHSNGPNQSLRVDFRSLDSYPFQPPASAVRMRMRGQWLLEPRARGLTRVSFMLDVDPKTAAPAFLVDPVLRDTVVQTLRGLDRMTHSVPTAHE